MPSWYCHHTPTPALARELCEGPRHRECGMRYAPGEYTVTKGAITLPGIGKIRTPHLAPAFVSPDAHALISEGTDGWAVEFLPGETITG